MKREIKPFNKNKFNNSIKWLILVLIFVPIVQLGELFNYSDKVPDPYVNITRASYYCIIYVMLGFTILITMTTNETKYKIWGLPIDEEDLVDISHCRVCGHTIILDENKKCTYILSGGDASGERCGCEKCIEQIRMFKK